MKNREMTIRENVIAIRHAQPESSCVSTAGGFTLGNECGDCRNCQAHSLLWKGEGKALFVLGNANGNKDEPARTTVALNAAALGLVGALEATDWWTKDPLPMTDNRLTVEVPGSGWRMIAICEDSDVSHVEGYCPGGGL